MIVDSGDYAISATIVVVFVDWVFFLYGRFWFLIIVVIWGRKRQRTKIGNSVDLRLSVDHNLPYSKTYSDFTSDR